MMLRCHYQDNIKLIQSQNNKRKGNTIMKKSLVIIDMQNDFITGSLGSPEAQAIVPKVKDLLNKHDYDKLIFTRDTHTYEYPKTQEGQKLPVLHCVRNTYGWQIHSDFDTTDATIINKYTFGYYDWKGMFDDVDEITLVGLCTDICVISNALIIKSIYPEKIINIVENATAGVTPETKAAALTTAKSCQINII